MSDPANENPDRPAPSDYGNPNMGPGPSGHAGPARAAADKDPADKGPAKKGPTDPDVTREPSDADSLKHEGEGYGSGDNALGRTRGGVVNISPDDHVEEAQDIHEGRKPG